VHQHFQNWHRAGFFQKLWQAGLAEYDGMHGIAWQWQAADGTMGKAPLATECTGRNPTDRGKKGRKRSLLVDGHGVPLSIAVSGANVHDSKLLERTLAQVVVQCPEVTTWQTALQQSIYRGDASWCHFINALRGRRQRRRKAVFQRAFNFKP
jgi:transposase